MSNIPKKGDKSNDAQNAEAKRQQKIATDVTTFTDRIVAAMGQNKTSYQEQAEWPEAEAQAQMIAAFKTQGWTVTFTGARSGGWIKWS